MHVAQMDDTQESIKQSRKEKLGLENKIRTYHFKNNENQLICTKKNHQNGQCRSSYTMQFYNIAANVTDL